MLKVSRYIDPTTRSYIVQRGNYVRISAAVAWVFNALMLERGSVPGFPEIGSDIHLVTHTGGDVVEELKAAAERAMSSGLNRVFLAYEVACWLQRGQPVISVSITTKRGVRPEVIEYRPWTERG
jgi:translation elongation factor EF-G